MTSARKISALTDRVAILERALVAFTGKPIEAPASDPISAARLAPIAVAAASKLFGVSAVEISSESRRASVSRARWAISWALRERGGFTFNSIGAALGLDHTSILYGVDRAAELRGTDANFRRASDDLLERLTNG